MNVTCSPNCRLLPHRSRAACRVTSACCGMPRPRVASATMPANWNCWIVISGRWATAASTCGCCVTAGWTADRSRYAAATGVPCARRWAAVVYDGATDLADWTPAQGIGEYLLVSDGLQNYGAQAMPTLAPTSACTHWPAPRLMPRAWPRLAESRGGRLVAWQGRAGLDAATQALLSGRRACGRAGRRGRRPAGGAIALDR